MSTVGLILTFLGIFALVLFLLAPRTPKPVGLRDRNDLVAYLEKVTQSGAAPAISVAVIRNNTVLWEHSVGIADPLTQRRADTDTVFHWWSVTKIATALTVLNLIEDGLIELDTDVATLLPFFQVTGLNDGSDPITIRHLLNHTSGLRDPIPAMFGWVRYDRNGPDQTVFLQKHFRSFRSLQFQPGADRRYSNLGFMVLGAVIEKVSGQRFEDAVTARVLAPTGMIDSGFIFDVDEDTEALGSHPIAHVFTPLLPFYLDLSELVLARRGTTLWFNRFYIDATPPTGLIGTARDVARLGQATMHPDMLDWMVPNNAARPLGWSEQGDGWYQHRGGGPGYAALLRIYPQEGLSIAVVGNGTALSVERIADAIYEVEHQ